MSRQFVAIRFNPWDRRHYTYHNDGLPVAVGDRVTVSTERGPEDVEVMSVTDKTPEFRTKPILGKAPPPVAGTDLFGGK